MNTREILEIAREHYRKIALDAGSNARALSVDISQSIDYGATAVIGWTPNEETIRTCDQDWLTSEHRHQIKTRRYLITSVFSDAGFSYDEHGAFSVLEPFGPIALERHALIVDIEYSDTQRQNPEYVTILHVGYGVTAMCSDVRSPQNLIEDLRMLRNDIDDIRRQIPTASTNNPIAARGAGSHIRISVGSLRYDRDIRQVVFSTHSADLIRVSPVVKLRHQGAICYNLRYLGTGASRLVVGFAVSDHSEAILINLDSNGAGFSVRLARPALTPTDIRDSERANRVASFENGRCGCCSDRVSNGFSGLRPSIRYGFVCNECHENEKENMFDLNEYMSNVRVLDYSTRPTVEFKRVNGNDPYFFGIELEVNAARSVSTQTMAQRIRDALKPALGATWYLKKDSSTVDDRHNGCEIVTTPQSYDSLELLQWRDGLNAMKDSKLTAYKSGLCGLHIHISRPSDSITSRMRAFLVSQQSWLIPFSARTQEQLDNFAAFRPDYRRTWSNNYGRYSALNETENTVELRFFRSTLSYGRFWASVQFAAALPLFAEQHSTATARDSVKCRAAWDAWIAAQPRYAHLQSYLQGQAFYRG